MRAIYLLLAATLVSGLFFQGAMAGGSPSQYDERQLKVPRSGSAYMSWDSPAEGNVAARLAAKPTVTPTPLPQAAVGSNAPLVCGAAVLVVIIVGAVVLHARMKSKA
jgi:hypothetical protein